MSAKTFAAIVFGMSLSSMAIGDAGTVIVNGEAVSPEVFESYQRAGARAHLVCPPKSDAYVVDHIVDMVLLRQDGKARGVAMPRKYKDRIAKRVSAFEALPQSAHPFDRALLVNNILHDQAWGYIEAQIPSITDQMVDKEYQRLLKAKDSLLTDVVTFRRLDLEIDNGYTDDIAKAAKLIAGGAKLPEVASALKHANVDSGQQEFETTKEGMKYYPWGRQEIGIGEIIGPFRSKRGVAYVQIIDKKHYPQVQPNDTVAGIYQYGKKQVRQHLYKQAREALIMPLWESASVTRNGEKLNRLADTNYNCH